MNTLIDQLKCKPVRFICFILVGVTLVWGQQTNTQSSVTDLDPKKLPVISGRIQDNELQVIYNIPEDQHQVIIDGYNFMDIQVDSVPGIQFGQTIYPEGEKDAEGNTVYHGIVILKKRMILPDKDILFPNSIRIKAGYQFCTANGTCLQPNSVELSIPLKDTSIVSVPPTQIKGSAAFRSSILFYLFIAFIGGLILNVMPCVLPVLSIKMISMVNTARQDRREILKGSMAYTAGVLFSFLILGIVVAILKIAGQSVGWGFQFQNIGFVVFLLTILWIFGLSLFDVFIIQIPGMQMASKASTKGGHWGSFMTGIFAVLLATPCTAPILGTALGWTFSQPPQLIVFSFLVIGSGLAFPFFLIGFFPKLIKIIPKPGAWMDTFKQVMAFLLMATVVFLLGVAYSHVGNQIIQIFWFLLIIAFACWILGKYTAPYKPKKIRIIAWIVTIVLSISAVLYFLNFNKSDPLVEQQTAISAFEYDSRHPDWYVFNPELLDNLLEENKPVFIDFAAEWCLTCKTNEITLFSKDIQKAFSEKGVVLLRGDYTKKNPLISEWLGKFNRAGVPLYVLYLPGQKEPIVFPELINKEMIFEQLNKITR